MLYESQISCKHGNILLFLTLKENIISNFFTIHIIEIPTNKGANSYKLNISKIGNSRNWNKEGPNSYFHNTCCFCTLGNALLVHDRPLCRRRVEETLVSVDSNLQWRHGHVFRHWCHLWSFPVNLCRLPKDGRYRVEMQPKQPTIKFNSI